ncbi:MAG TPA: hypothetical protein VHD76_05820 [Bryobacteraceae bacterium]|nr:hypothetical protein [Bryobacteraceae bacterium]
MKTKLLALVLLAGGSVFAGPRVFVGVGIGFPPPPPPRVVAYVPPAPGPNYIWVAGYWYPNGPRYAWRPGYWAVRPYPRARWVAPRYYRGRYYHGHWRR